MTEFSVQQLAASVREWCEKNHAVPANGQAAEEISERNIRYYRTLGLLDPPLGNYNKTFSEKHRLQLIGIRIFQAQGLPLRKIRDELYGKSMEDLQSLEKQVSRRGEVPAVTFTSLPAAESWCVMPLAGEYMLISRHNRALPSRVIEKINELLGTLNSGEK